MTREEFLTANLDSDKKVQMSPQERIFNLGDFCESHLELIQGGNSFIRRIAEHRVDKAMKAVNSSSNQTA